VGQAVNTKNTHGLVLGPYPSPYAEVVQRECPVCGKRTLTMDHLRKYEGWPRLLCCSCGVWGSAYPDRYVNWDDAVGKRAWDSLQNYGKRVADELIKDP